MVRTNNLTPMTFRDSFQRRVRGTRKLLEKYFPTVAERLGNVNFAGIVKIGPASGNVVSLFLIVRNSYRFIYLRLVNSIHENGDIDPSVSWSVLTSRVQGNAKAFRKIFSSVSIERVPRTHRSTDATGEHVAIHRSALSVLRTVDGNAPETTPFAHLLLFKANTE